MGGSIVEEKSSFKMLVLTFSSKLDWGSYIISIAKTASKKIGALIRSMKSLFHEVALHLYKSSWCPQLLLGFVRQATKTDMQDYCPSLTASLEPLAHPRNVASLSLFYRCYFGRCSSELAQLVPLPFS